MLVGFDKADDAGVYRLSPELALVQTVDFFTPIVDDPFTFGQIAAVNSLSDVYAMGGRPLSALAMVCFPEKGDLEILQRILAGGLAKMMEAECVVLGGHSVRDDEIKFGYAVTGTVHPDRVLANSGARAGDRLVLTKALGTGVIATAIKKQRAEKAWVEAATAAMTHLNKRAAELAIAAHGVHAITDVTGFGLIGHAREMALASGVALTMTAGAVPLLPGAAECVRAGHIPGGLNANREFAECSAEFAESVAPELKTLLFDAQTAGGLLISVDPHVADDLVAALKHAGEDAALIGEVVRLRNPLIVVD